MRRIILTTTMAVLLCIAPVAVAETATQVNNFAASLPGDEGCSGCALTSTYVAQLKEQAKENVLALKPHVESAVTAGYGQTVQESTYRDVKAAVVKYEARKQSVHAKLSEYPKPTGVAARFRAHTASGCWYWAWNQTQWYTFWGSTIGWLYARVGWWCNDDPWGSINRDGDVVTNARWSWGPYCFANTQEGNAYDYPYSWIHIGNWGTFGISYPWGCWGMHGGHATVRIAGNGYWDTVDDWNY